MMASLLLWQQPAASAPDFQVHQPVIACVDAKATYALTDRKRAARHSPQWLIKVQRLGRCFTIQPEEHWERISRLGDLVLMRRTPPQPGLPPLYFRADAPIAAPPVADDSTIRPSQVMSPPVLEAPSWAARTPTPYPDDTITRIQLGSLPPPSAIAAEPAIAPIPPAAGPMEPAAASVSPGSSAAYAYGIGFAAAILLTIGLLAIVALLIRGLLLWSPKRAPPKPLLHEDMLPPVPVRVTSRTQNVVRWSLPLTASPNMLQPAGQPSLPEGWLSDEEIDAQRRCALMLRDAGWDAYIRPSSDRRPADVVASRGGRVMALRCLPAGVLVDEQAIEEVCVARERERADLAVIVSNAIYTERARQLAAHIGIDLLDENQLGPFIS